MARKRTKAKYEDDLLRRAKEVAQESGVIIIDSLNLLAETDWKKRRRGAKLPTEWPAVVEQWIKEHTTPRRPGGGV